MRLSKRTLVAGSCFLVVAALLLQATPAKADPSNNPVFATIRDVSNAISAALAPIQTAVSDLQSQQSAQESQISGLQDQVNSLKNNAGKSLRVYSADGEELGVLVDHSAVAGSSFYTVFSPALNRIIYLSTGTLSSQFLPSGIGNAVDAYYQSSDCSGTPYFLSTGITGYYGQTYTPYDNAVNELLPVGPGQYYILQNPETPVTISVNSKAFWNHGSASVVCQPGQQTDVTAYQMYPVDLPFTTPLSLPLQIKYQ